MASLFACLLARSLYREPEVENLGPQKSWPLESKQATLILCDLRPQIRRQFSLACILAESSDRLEGDLDREVAMCRCFHCWLLMLQPASWGAIRACCCCCCCTVASKLGDEMHMLAGCVSSASGRCWLALAEFRWPACWRRDLSGLLRLCLWLRPWPVLSEPDPPLGQPRELDDDE